MKFNILGLKVPVFAEDETRIPFIGLALIANALKGEGYSVRQIDLNAVSRRKGYYYDWLKPPLDALWSFDRAIGYLNSGKDPQIELSISLLLDGVDFKSLDFILLSVGLYDNKSSIMGLCLGKHIKKLYPGIKIAIGGERYPNYEPIYQILNKVAHKNCLDFYIRGFGEAPLLDLLQTLEHSEMFDDIPGVYSIVKGIYVGSAPREDYQIRLPDYDGLIDEWHTWNAPEYIAKRMFNQSSVQAKIIPIKLIHGCPNRCSFCRSSLQERKYINHIDADVLVERIQYFKKVYDTRYFFFSDDVFNISSRFVKNLYKELKRADILWSDCVQFRGWTKDLINKAQEAGAVKLIFGMETASPRLQKLINKNINIKHAEKVLKWSHEAGIFNGLEIISGLPTETAEDVIATINFIEKNRDYLDEITLNSFYLLRGSLMGKRPGKYGIENIRQIITPDGEPEKRYHPLYTLNFDEINGLKWNQKIKQIAEATDAVRECITRNNLQEGNQDRLHVLFTLYNQWKSKKEVRQRYLWWKEISALGLEILNDAHALGATDVIIRVEKVNSK